MGRTVGALAACAAALSIVGAAHAASVQLGLARGVHQLTGRMFSVACLSRAEFGGADWAGLTEFDTPPRIFLAPSTCAGLLHRPGTDEFDLAYGVKTLAHEAGHAFLNTACEYRAETYAMSNWQRLYRLMVHRAPTPAQVAYVDATHDQLPASYLSPAAGC